MSRKLSIPFRFLDSALSWIFQTECLSCRRPVHGETLCDGCAVLSRVTGERVGFTFLDRCFSSFWLSEAALKVLHRVKYRSQPEWLSIFKEKAERSLEELHDTNSLPACRVPVPLHWKRYWTRGFNQAEILATWAKSGRVSRGLVKGRETASQSLLDREGRGRNLRLAFHWRENFVPEEVLLVDDIVTTGATLEACAEVLKKAGVKRVEAWTLFRTP